MEKKYNNINKPPVDIKRVDTKEFELPETLFVSDIDTKVFQGIVLECLSNIEGIDLVQGNFIDNILGRTGPEVASGIHSEQDSKNQSVNIKIEVNVRYGINIPQKAEEIQTKVVQEITRLTSLRVASIHVLFRNIIPKSTPVQNIKKNNQATPSALEEYSDDF